MKKKYQSLRTIASFIKFIASLFLLVAILEIMLLLYFSNIIESQMPNELQSVKILLDDILGAHYIVIIITSIISYILISSSAERIRLLIDIEENSRSIDFTLKQLLHLNENSLGILAPELKEEVGLFTSIKRLFD